MKLDISTREGYNVATALIGPGTYNLSTLKELVTGEIRRVCKVSPGPLTRDGLIDTEALRRETLWLHNAVVRNVHLRTIMTHWLSHACAGLIELGCEHDHWLHRFVFLLNVMVRTPHCDDTLERVDRHLDKFTEEGSRIGDEK